MKKYKVYILAVSVLIIITIIWNTLTEPGIKDLKSDFKEVAFIRNEQNTGPVIRIYAVSLKTENWEEMEKYGNYMPHTKYGTTRIYFFLSNGEIHEKDGMSQISIRKYPFNN